MPTPNADHVQQQYTVTFPMGHEAPFQLGVADFYQQAFLKSDGRAAI
jgi:hypothetical protein